MTKKQLKTLKRMRVASQGIFFILFIYIFTRSLDPFSIAVNPFLRFDPLILFTHLRFSLKIVLPIAGMVILTLILGRYFCGWVCPLGSLIDMLDWVLKPLRRLNAFSKKGDAFKKKLNNLPPSWFILGVIAVTLFFTPPILQFLHPNVWIIRIFSLSALGTWFLGMLVLFSAITRRLWCTVICPLGALYGILSRISLLKLSIKDSSGCGSCDTCPMSASRYESNTILSHQCILCFDFEYRCPALSFSFGYRELAPEKVTDESRRDFLMMGVLFAGGILTGSLTSLIPKHTDTKLIRPPGVLNETRFVEKCLRCFQCVRSCPNRIIKITGFEGGLGSLFTPHINFEDFGCDYYCQVCQQACPNFAIPLQLLEEKQRTKIGLASIDKKLCVVFAKNINCLVCEEFCPVPEKAIKVTEETKIVDGEPILLRYPVMDNDLCIGCGICEVNCPVLPERAIVISKT